MLLEKLFPPLIGWVSGRTSTEKPSRFSHPILGPAVCEMCFPAPSISCAATGFETFLCCDPAAPLDFYGLIPTGTSDGLCAPVSKHMKVIP